MLIQYFTYFILKEIALSNFNRFKINLVECSADSVKNSHTVLVCDGVMKQNTMLMKEARESQLFFVGLLRSFETLLKVIATQPSV